MKKMIFLLLVLLISIQSLQAQQPETIDVTSYTLHKKVNWSVAKFVMTARTASGEFFDYVGTGNYQIAQLTSCNPCNLPNVFSGGAGFYTESFGVSFNWGFDVPVRFYVTSVEAAPIALRPTVSRKTQKIVKEGLVTVKGRIEVGAPGEILAVDNSVQLEGVYTSEFVPLNHLDGRKIQFTQINYNLTATQ